MLLRALSVALNKYKINVYLCYPNLSAAHPSNFSAYFYMINNEKRVLAAINDDMKSAKSKKRKNDERQDEQLCARRCINDEESEVVEWDEAICEADLLQKLPVKSDVSVNEYM